MNFTPDQLNTMYLAISSIEQANEDEMHSNTSNAQAGSTRACVK